jgi:hypothetical protein
VYFRQNRISIIEPRRREGHEGRRKKKEEEENFIPRRVEEGRSTFSASVCFAIPILPICLINVPLCENVKRTLKPKVRKGLLNALSHISDAKYQNILFVKLVPDWLNN